MAQEQEQDASEISLEETNKIRISLGLKPIPTPTQDGSTRPETGINGRNESISVEETNRIRASLGLKQLPVSGETDSTSQPGTSTSYVDQDAQARENWMKKHSVEKKAADEEHIKKKIEESKERAERRKKLEGETLGGDDNTSTKSWLLNLRQNQKEDKKFVGRVGRPKKTDSAVGYDSTDLKGLRVSHEMSEIHGEHGDVILTLKDSSVLDDDDKEIVLESTELNEKRKLKDKLRAKRGLRATSEDEYSDGELTAKNVLSKYDDVLNEDEITKGFSLDGSSLLTKAPRPVSAKQEATKVKEALEFDVQALDGSYDTGDITGVLGADYLEAKPAKFKKPKSKMKVKAAQSISKKRQREEEAEDQDLDTIVDAEDDFDLQAALSASRRRAQKQQVKKSRILTDQELAEQIQSEEQQEETTPENGKLVISSTTEFLSIIKQQTKNGSDESKVPQRDESSSPQPQQDDAVVERDPSSMEVDVEEAENNVQGPIDASVLAPDEPTLSGGLGDALKLLRSHGVLKQQDVSTELEQEQKSRQREWSRQMTRERVKRDIDLLQQRERERSSGKFDKLSQKEREEIAQMENREREVMEAREAQRRFANYKPGVNIEYRDDNGRLLNQKEAYKHLSHQFHGKGPGKGKVEKQIKKDEEEKKIMSQSVFGTTDNTKRTSGAAGVRLQ